MKKLAFPLFAVALAVLCAGAHAFGLDAVSLFVQYPDALSGAAMLAAAGTMDVKDLVPLIEGVKKAADTRLHEVAATQLELSDRLLQLEQKGALLPGDGAPAARAEDIGLLVSKSQQLDSLRDGSAKVVRLAVKAFPLGQKAAVTNANFPSQAMRDLEVYGPLPRRLTVRDLLVTRPTTAAAVEYLKATRTGAAAIQAAEGDAKAELAVTSELVTAQVRTIACWVPASRQVMDDSAQLQDFINTTLLDALQLTEDSQLLMGTGVGSNVLGLMPSATAYNRGQVGDTPNDTLRRAITQVQLARGVASGIVINPEGLERLELQKDGEGRYLVSLTVTDANGRAVSWRVPVVVTDAIAANAFLVGDFTLAARLYDRQQASVEVSTQHADFFVRNMLAILAEERVALTVPRPDLLVKGVFPE